MMNTRRTNSPSGLATIILIACIGLPTAHSLWIPISRNTNRIPQLVRTVKAPKHSQEAAPFPAAAKRDAGLEPPILSAESPGSNGAALAYAVDVPEEELQERQPVTEAEATAYDDGQDDEDIEKHWPITPRACLVLMKILHAQTAEIMEQGNADEDFYEAASYYQPAIRTLSKCMDMADRGYETIVLD